MASSSGTSSGSSQKLQNSRSEKDLQHVVDLRKRKRMISNRESARRSRMKKQKRLEDLMAQLDQLRNNNNQFLANMNITTQLFFNIEAENTILRAQISELSHRLQSLNDIIKRLNASNTAVFEIHAAAHDPMINIFGDDLLNPLNLLYVNQPIMASADGLMY